VVNNSMLEGKTAFAVWMSAV